MVARTAKRSQRSCRCRGPATKGDQHNATGYTAEVRKYDMSQSVATHVKATWSVRDFLFLLQNHVKRYELYLLSRKDSQSMLEVENRCSKGCLTLFIHRPRGVFETVVGVAKSPEGNA